MPDLQTSVEASLQAARAAGLRCDPSDPGTSKEAKKAWESVLRLVGFKPTKASCHRGIPARSQLTEEQRVVLRELPEGLLNLETWPVYASPRVRREWLGTDAPELFFAPVESKKGATTFLEELRRLAKTDEDSARMLFFSRPVLDQVELLAWFPKDDLADFLPMSVRHDLASALNKLPAGSVASDRAHALLAHLLALNLDDTGDWGDEWARMALLTRLAAGFPILPEHDRLLRLDFNRAAGLEISLRSIGVIPQERRDTAVLAAMRRVEHALDRQLQLGLHYLRDFPLLETARYLRERAGRRASGGWIKQALAAVAERQPTLRDILFPKKTKRAKSAIPNLKVGRRLVHPGVEMLEDVHRLQLEQALRLYCGKAVRAADLLAKQDECEETGIDPDSIELRVLVDRKGQALYDAWLYNADSGTVFRANTVEQVAEVIQGGVETDSAELEEVLSAFLGYLPEKRKRS